MHIAKGTLQLLRATEYMYALPCAQTRSEHGEPSLDFNLSIESLTGTSFGVVYGKSRMDSVHQFRAIVRRCSQPWCELLSSNWTFLPP